MKLVVGMSTLFGLWLITIGMTNEKSSLVGAGIFSLVLTGIFFVIWRRKKHAKHDEIIFLH